MSDQGNGAGSNGSNGAKGIFYHPSSLSAGIDLSEIDETLSERARGEIARPGNGESYFTPPEPTTKALSPPIRQQLPPAPGPAVTSEVPIGGEALAHQPPAARAPSRPSYRATGAPNVGGSHTQAIGFWDGAGEEGHMLGISTVTVATAAVIGLRFGGTYGGIAGSLFGGAAINALRAIRHSMQGTPDGDREAMVSGTYTVVAAALGGYLTWQGMKAKRSAA